MFLRAYDGALNSEDVFLFRLTKAEPGEFVATNGGDEVPQVRCGGEDPSAFAISLSSICDLVSVRSSNLFTGVPRAVVGAIPSYGRNAIYYGAMVVLSSFIRIYRLFTVLVVMFFSARNFPSNRDATSKYYLSVYGVCDEWDYSRRGGTRRPSGA